MYNCISLFSLHYYYHVFLLSIIVLFMIFHDDNFKKLSKKISIIFGLVRNLELHTLNFKPPPILKHYYVEHYYYYCNYYTVIYINLYLLCIIYIVAFLYYKTMFLTLVTYIFFFDNFRKVNQGFNYKIIH